MLYSVFLSQTSDGVMLVIKVHSKENYIVKLCFSLHVVLILHVGD